MALSQPVSVAKLLAAKVLTRGTLLIGFIAGLALAGALVLGIDLTDGRVLRTFCAWLAIVIAYGAFWFILALAMNTLHFSSAANALGLAGVWLLLVLIVPSVLSAIAGVLYPVPSRVEMIQASREASRQASQEGSSLLPASWKIIRS